MKHQALFELEEEMRHHIELLIEHECSCGASEHDARAAALERFGDPDRHARACLRAQGGSIMNKWMKIGWNTALAAGIIVAVVMAILAKQSSDRLLTMAKAERNRSPEDLRASILQSIWEEERGEVTIEGKVARPGKFATSIEKPVSVAHLLELAGGAASDAKGIAWRQSETSGEGWMTLRSAQKHRDDFNAMPAPGAVLTVK